MKSHVEVYSQLLDILKDIKKNPIHRQGICINVRNRLRKDVNTSYIRQQQFVDLVAVAASNWPEYSGHLTYPVHTDKQQHPAHQYSKTWFYWTRLTSYGRARRRLLNFLINHFEKLVKNNDTL